MKHKLFTTLLVMLSLSANAFTVEVEGIWYNLFPDIKTAEVTNNLNKYVGSISIPEEITYNGVTYDVNRIGYNAFSGCSELSSITIPISIKSIENSSFESCTGLTAINIPNSVTRIEGYAFAGCKGLTSLVIPNGVTHIGGACAFSSCTSLSSITILQSIRNIGSSAFSGCNNLTTIKVMSSYPPTISDDTFKYLYDKVTVYVPTGCENAYNADNNWKKFKSIIGIDYYAAITMNSSGIATYSNGSGLDFTSVDGLKAYIGSGYSPSTGELMMMRVNKVPAGEGLLLKGAAGSYEIPYTETDMYYSNLLVGVPTATTVNPTEGDYTNFILANGANGIGFYTLSAAGEIGPNKAYLQLPTSVLPATSSSRQIKLLFDDEEEVTGIESLTPAPLQRARGVVTTMRSMDANSCRNLRKQACT